MSHVWVRYMEIGAWKGSTHISALYKNFPEYTIAIDNFSQYEGTLEIFKENCKNIWAAKSILFTVTVFL